MIGEGRADQTDEAWEAAHVETKEASHTGNSGCAGGQQSIAAQGVVLRLRRRNHGGRSGDGHLPRDEFSIRDIEAEITMMPTASIEVATSESLGNIFKSSNDSGSCLNEEWGRTLLAFYTFWGKSFAAWAAYRATEKFLKAIKIPQNGEGVIDIGLKATA
jgi:hypothetical protein